jgi:hypothetical protein
LQAVEKPASPGFSAINGRKMSRRGALKETGGRNEFRHPLKYDLFCLCRTLAHFACKNAFASGEKGRIGVFGLFRPAEKAALNGALTNII